MKRLLPALAFVTGTLLLGLTATRARADLTITATDVSVVPNGTGIMDFTITSDSSDHLALFGLTLLITPGVGANQDLSFVDQPSQPTVFDQPGYVFTGNSFDQMLPIPFWFPPTTTTYPNDSINGGDAYTGASGFVTIPATVGGGDTFLAAVEFSVLPGAALGETFQISLANGTVFDDENGNSVPVKAFNGGLVTVGAGAVPEPSSLVMLAISGLGGLFGCWRNRRRA